LRASRGVDGSGQVLAAGVFFLSALAFEFEVWLPHDKKTGTPKT